MMKIYFKIALLWFVGFFIISFIMIFLLKSCSLVIENKYFDDKIEKVAKQYIIAKSYDKDIISKYGNKIYVSVQGFVLPPSITEFAEENIVRIVTVMYGERNISEQLK